MTLPIGTKVRRGPTWEFDDQDGGEGEQGEVAAHNYEYYETDFTIKVLWDNGHLNNYRHTDVWQDVVPLSVVKPLKEYL